jgi:uronate dehydrogenase
VDRVAGEVRPGEEAVIADLSRPGVPEQALAGASGVIYLAADPRVAASWEEVYQANVVLTRRVLDAASARGVPRLVLASTVHVMGDLRLGSLGHALDEARYLGMWLSGRDAGALMRAALTAGPGWSVHFGMSANTRRPWDLGSARKLGYAPQDDSEPYAATAGPPATVTCRIFDDRENPPAGTEQPGGESR